MDPHSVGEVAAILLGARRSSRPAELPSGLLPATAEDAYAVQDVVAREAGPIAGWKVGVTTRGEPVRFAPIFHDQVFESPARIAPADFRLVGVEAELAFRLASDPTRRPGPATRREVIASVAAMHVVIEVVGTRFADVRAAPALAILADNQCHGALIVGMEVSGWQGRDLVAPALRVEVDGDHAAGPSPNPAGDPIELLRELAEHCKARGWPLPAGTVVTTGSCTGLFLTGSAGRVSVRLDGREAVLLRVDDEGEHSVGPTAPSALARTVAP